MAHYQCEALSSCEKFQSVICLHCNCRLCLQHLREHHATVLADVDSISNLVGVTLQQIKEKSEKNRIHVMSISRRLTSGEYKD